MGRKIEYFRILSSRTKWNLMQESKKPERYLVVGTDLCVVAGIDDVVVGLLLVADGGIADLEADVAVDEEDGVVDLLVDFVVFPERVDEECLHRQLPLYMDGINGIEEVGVVEHHLRRLLGEVLALGIDHVDEARICQILDVVHHGSPTRLDIGSQLTDIGSLGTALGQLVEELLDLGQILQFDLLDEQDVDLGHHVHRLEQVLGVVAMLLEEGIETVVDVVLEIAAGGDIGQDLLDDLLVVVEDVVERVGLEVGASEEVEELAEGEATQIVALHDAVELRILVLQAHHARAREHNLQAWVQIVAATQFARPVVLLEHLIDEQHTTARVVEVARKVGDASTLEVEVVHVDIEALAILEREILLGILQEEGRLPYSTRALNAYQTAVPINLIHQQTTNRSIHMLDEIAVGAKECFHNA